jgi:sugar lactone lactonase YvrE
LPDTFGAGRRSVEPRDRGPAAPIPYGNRDSASAALPRAAAGLSFRMRVIPPHHPAVTPTVVPALASIRNTLGEGALWHARTGRLYWVDIAGHKVHAYEPATGRTLTALVGESVGTVVPTRRREVLVALQRRFAFLDLVEARLTPFPVEPLLPEPHRFNDGKCDSAGRLWVGSMDAGAATGEGVLWRLGTDLHAEPRRHGYSIPNGIAWSLDGRTLYHVDSPTRRVESFAFDPVDGALSAPQTLREFTEADGVPDGMTIDAMGHLWIALWGGSRVVCLDSTTGVTRAEIALPVSQPSSCAFGGPSLDTLYITTARIDLGAAELASQPLAGAVFEVLPGAVGVPANEFGG